MIDDTSSYFTGVYQAGSVNVGWVGVLGAANRTNSIFTPSTVPFTPVFGFLTQRPWWGGAATATTFVPPSPPTPASPHFGGGGPSMG